jgi:DNA-binding NarL/FixJ family response regulator
VSALTAREAQVLALLCERWTDREIGAMLGISHRTVESHAASIYRRLGVGDRRAACRGRA